MQPTQISVNNLLGSSNDTLPSIESQKTEDHRRGASLNDFPDGGLRAWLVVFGAWAANICSFGWINCECILAESQVLSADILCANRHRSLPGLLPGEVSERLLS